MDYLKQIIRSRKEVGNPVVTVKFTHFNGLDEMLDIVERNEWLGQAPVLE